MKENSTPKMLNCLFLIICVCGFPLALSAQPSEAIGKMVLIKGGSFTMGDVFESSLADEDERPVRTVTIKDFYMDATEVTVGEFKKFVEATGRKMPAAPPWGWIDDHPMVMVEWAEANAYAKWAGKRLPTEAEWEYAAREGGKKLLWSGVNDSTELKSVAWYANKEAGVLNFEKRAVGVSTTMPVAKKDPNALGLYDMSGNVWEWCSDWYDKNYYSAAGSNDNPTGPMKGLAHSVRGGSWFTWARTCRTTNRWYLGHRFKRDDDVGFRCVKDVE